MGFKDKLKKLVLNTEKEQTNEEPNVSQEEIALRKKLIETKAKALNALDTFSVALYELNSINAKLNRGPVNIEDILSHHCVAQETLNRYYAYYHAKSNAEHGKEDSQK